jgi:tripartite ATP-independent transporter DctM subunit
VILAMFGVFLAALLIGVPIALSVGLSVVAAMGAADFGDSLYIIPQQILEGIDNVSLLAIPFFILAGNLMNAVGITDRIFNFAEAVAGHFKAGLAQVNVLASMIFAGVNGAAVADCAGLGKIEIGAMKQRGYPPEFAAAVTVASSVIGPLIPPSIGLLVYAYLSQTSVARLFLAGLVPGVLVGLALMATNRIYASLRDFPSNPRASLREVVHAGRLALPAMVAPGFIVVAIVWGFATAHEAGVIACAYALGLGALTGRLRARELWSALSDTVIVTSVIMMIIGFTTVMGWLIAIEQVPQALAAGVLAATDDRNVFLLITVVFLVLIGCFIEGVPAKLILVPIFLPIVDRFGIDRVHFGLIVQLALLIGIATPPMGVGLFIVAEIARVPFERVTLATIPFLVPLVLVLLLITFVPEFSLWLPDLVLGPEH